MSEEQTAVDKLQGYPEGVNPFDVLRGMAYSMTVIMKLCGINGFGTTVNGFDVHIREEYNKDAQ